MINKKSFGDILTILNFKSSDSYLHLSFSLCSVLDVVHVVRVEGALHALPLRVVPCATPIGHHAPTAATTAVRVLTVRKLIATVSRSAGL